MQRACGLLCLLFFASAPSLWAQATATTGQIEGLVTNESGAVLPATSVSVRNVDTGFQRSSQSDAGGVYRLSLLPIGTYELTAQLAGFATLKRGGLTLQVGETLTLPLGLKLATVEETVTVTAESPVVEMTRSLTASTVNLAAIASLPINGRRFQDFVLLTPGAVLENQRGGTAISGQRGINAAYSIDGASYDNPFFGGIKGGERSGLAYTISQEAIREFRVTNAGYSAEFGRSGAGVVNAVTKSGTNETRGTVFWYFRNEGLVADNPDVLVQRRYAPKRPTDFKQHQFGASLGGPLEKDKTHYFLAYDQQVLDEPSPVAFSSNPAGIPGFDGQPSTYIRTNDVWTALARLDYRVSGEHHFWVRYNYSRNEGQNGLLGSNHQINDTPDYNSLEKDSTNTLVAQYSTVISPQRLNELRVQWAREDRPRQPNVDSPTINVTGLGRTGRVTFLPSLQTDDRFQVLDNFTILRGNHAYRVGFDLNFTHTKQPFFLSRSGGEYRFNSVADYLATVNGGQQRWRDFRQGFGRADVDFWQKEYAVYVQDTWRARRNLSLNYGVRYEAQIEPQPDNPNPSLPGSDKIDSDTNNIGPRLGIAWDPWNDNKGVVRLNAGLFYARTPALLLVSPFTNNGRAQLQLSFLPTSPGAPRFPNVLSSPPTGVAAPRTDANVFADSFDNPRTLQISVGLEREVRSGLTLSVDYVYSRIRQLERLFDANIAPASGQAPDGRLVYRNPRPNPGFNRILRAESTARGAYQGLTLAAKRRWSGGERWFNKGMQFQAYYTYARSKDDDSNERNFAALFYQDWQNLSAQYTWSDNDARHNFVANGIWSLAWDFQVGAIFLMRSGVPYTHLANVDLNNDGDFGNDRQFVSGVDTGRNRFRQAKVSRLDLRITKTFKLGSSSGGRSLDLGVDLFNVLNAENLFVSVANRNFLGSGPGGLNPNLDVPDSLATDPRTAQLSVRFRF